MSPAQLRAVRVSTLALALLAAGCGSAGTKSGPPVVLSDGAVSARITLSPFALRIENADGETVLDTLHGSSQDAYGSLAATVDDPIFLATSLPGWDGYLAQEGAWHHATRATLLESTDHFAKLALAGHGVKMHLDVTLDAARVRLHVVTDQAAGTDKPLDKMTMAFSSGKDEHFFGMGERYATVDHRGWPIYSWAEEGALGKGESAPVSAKNPYPNGPSMTYFPVPFFLSNRGYGVHLDTTFRTEVYFDSDQDDAWRFDVNADHFDATVYVHKDPLASLSDYTADTGRPLVPASWVFGPRRRVGVNATVNGVPEWQLMREKHVPVTGIDDAVHFLPALSQTGRESELSTWTKTLHEAGYKVMAYNNPYVAANNDSSASDYAYGVTHNLFVRGPDGKPELTEFISGKLLDVAAIDFTNPAAAAWFKDLLKRTLSLGYDGWMHDFGEYTARDARLYDGRRGKEVHNQYPVLSAKAAHDLLSSMRPGNYLFFVRSGYSGTQKYVPAVWGGDAEATFDNTLGLPSAVRGGVNLSMSGVPYWGSDMTGFKCITDAPNDKEVWLRWVEFGSVSPIMMEQNACSNPVGAKKTKWNLWNDDETIQLYSKYARLHTRLMPYFEVLAKKAHETGTPITLHPFLLFPDDPESWAVEDAYFLGPALYAWPVVHRGQTGKKGWLPPGRYVDMDDFSVYKGGQEVTIPAPLDKLPLLLVENQILPLLDPSIDTLAPATDPSVVTPADVADRLDAKVALAPGGHAELTLADGTRLVADRLDSDHKNPGKLQSVAADTIADCAACYHQEKTGDVNRLEVTTALSTGSDITLANVHLVVENSPMRRIRWDVARLP